MLRVPFSVEVQKKESSHNNTELNSFSVLLLLLTFLLGRLPLGRLERISSRTHARVRFYSDGVLADHDFV